MGDVQHEHDAVEVVVVGSGIAGSTVTAELAESGFDVLTLEAGPERTIEDMVSSQLWARRLKWGGPPILAEGDLAGGLNFGMGWGTGGAGAHWYGNWYRFHENDFKERSLYGQGLDWPIEYGDLRPWYDRADKYFGASGNRAREPWSPPADPYPMPPLGELPQSTAIKRGFDALEIPTSPNSVAINSERYDERAPCILDGWCDAGCPIGALANPLVLQWPKALRAGAELRHKCYVTAVKTDASGARATGVEYRDAAGEVHMQPADIVIVACHTVPNVRLLLLSASGSHPNGLANRSGMVGHHFMSHPSLIIYGILEDETQPHLGVTGGNLFSQEGYDDKQPADATFGSRAWLCGQAAKPNGLLGIAVSRPDLYGSALDKFLREDAKRFANMTAVCEETSVKENRVELDRSVTDAHGLPVAKVINNIPKENAARLDLAREEGLRIFRAAGASDPWAGSRVNIHLAGGTPMGDDPERSVTNSFGQTHEVDNLFIAGASLFPTIAAVNPTGTLAALALRTVEYIKENRATLVG